MANACKQVSENLGTKLSNPQKFTSPFHAKNLLQSLCEVKKISGVCDGCIVIEGKEILVQRSVLAAASPYFRAFFNFDSNKVNCSNIERQILSLEYVKSSAFESILEFIYSGEIIIGEDNVEDLLQAADLLLMSDLKELCFDYLEQCIAPPNCLGILEFTERFTCPRVNFKANEVLNNCFSEVSLSEEFLLLNEERLTRILQRHNLSVPSEEVVLAALMRWISNNPTRNNRFPDLVRECVRIDVVNSSKLTIENLFHSLSTTEIKVPISKNWHPRGQVDALVVCGGYQGNSDEVSKKVCCTELPPNRVLHSGDWLSLAPLLTTRAHHSVVEAGNY
uniref:BTB domain-containing protein n=1 Tax=Strigamia maritima TaxID=126957 RepID=T1JLZ1_STRMM